MKVAIKTKKNLQPIKVEGSTCTRGGNRVYSF